MGIDSVFRPAWGWILIKEDPAAEKVGEIFVPDRSKGTGSTLYGSVVRCGPEVPAEFAPERQVEGKIVPGTRVLYSRLSSRTELSMDGERRVLLAYTDVFALMGREGGIFDKSWADHATAPPGRILVERAELPDHRGVIILPGQDNVRASEVEVKSVGARAEGFSAGERAFASGNMARHATFGIPGDDPRTLWQCSPRELVAHLGKFSGVRGEVSPAAGADRLPSLLRDNDVWDEGDKGAPQ